MLVVGGGLAALSAAISAADNGATVLLINKGITGNSGSSAKAAGILAAEPELDRKSTRLNSSHT